MLRNGLEQRKAAAQAQQLHCVRATDWEPRMYSATDETVEIESDLSQSITCPLGSFKKEEEIESKVSVNLQKGEGLLEQTLAW